MKTFNLSFKSKTALLLLAFIIQILCFSTIINAQSILPSDSKIQYTGRIDFTNPNLPTYKYPSVKIKAKFNGTGITATINDSGDGTDSKANFYKVIIDGTVLTEQVKMLAGENDYVLATGLASGDHTLELIKITEGASGNSTFKGFTIEGGAQALLDLPATSDKKIEFIGDSWTCGFGNLSQFTTGNASMVNANYVAKNEDNYYAWGPITARALGADYQVTASSGRGLYRNNTGSKNNTIPLNYNYILEDDHSVEYNHDFKSDVIVIHIGTNDLAQEEGGTQFKLDDGVFEKTYIDFISHLLTVQPCSQIVICFGNSKSDSWPTWTKQLSRLRTIADNIINIHNKGNVTKLELPFTAEKWTGNKADDCGYGDAWHPSLCSHQEMSAELVAKINSMSINWGNQTNCPALADTSLWVNTHVNTTEVKTQSNTVTIYPNPVQSQLFFSDASKVDNWIIYNSIGQEIKKGNASIVNTNDLEKGIYTVIVISGNQNKSLKFVKN